MYEITEEILNGNTFEIHYAYNDRRHIMLVKKEDWSDIRDDEIPLHRKEMIKQIEDYILSQK